VACTVPSVLSRLDPVLRDERDRPQRSVTFIVSVYTPQESSGNVGKTWD
jgi:hypothetical protein